MDINTSVGLISIGFCLLLIKRLPRFLLSPHLIAHQSDKNPLKTLALVKGGLHARVRLGKNPRQRTYRSHYEGITEPWQDIAYASNIAMHASVKPSDGRWFHDEAGKWMTAEHSGIAKRQCEGFILAVRQRCYEATPKIEERLQDQLYRRDRARS